MHTANSAGAGSGPRVVDGHVVAVYDPVDGRIVHLHLVRVFEGARSVSKEEAVEGARHGARARGHELEGLETLHAKKAPGRGPHRVDLATMRLVPLDDPRAG